MNCTSYAPQGETAHVEKLDVHGMGVEGRWFEVSEALAVRWGERTLAVRHLKAALKVGWTVSARRDDDADD